MPTDRRKRTLNRDLVIPFLIIVALSALSLLLHLKWCGTPMQAPESRWEELIEHHRTVHPFSIRYLTTYTVKGIRAVSGMPLRESFFFLQYLLMATVGFAFWRFLRRLDFSRGWAGLGLTLFLTSFPVLFAHGEPVFTWDDGWQYLFLLLAVGAIIGRRLWQASLFFLLGCLAREQMLFYAPVLVLGLQMFFRSETLLRRFLTIAVPTVAYLVFYFAHYFPREKSLLEFWQMNFGTGPATANSMFSLFIAFGAIWMAWGLGLHRMLQRYSDERVLFLGRSSLLAVVPTLAIGLVLTQARETRLFFPIFVFLIPLALYWLRDESMRTYWHLGRRRLILAISTVALIALAFTVINLLRPNLDYRGCPDFCYNWLGIQIGLSAGLILMSAMSKVGRGRKSDSIDYCLNR